MGTERLVPQAQGDIQKNQIAQGIRKGSIEDLSKIFDDVVSGLKWEKISTYPLLKKFKKLMPPHIPHDVNQKAAEALLSTDPHLRDNGQKAFLLFNAKTILSVVNSYFVKGADTQDDREDMTQSAILAVMEKFSKRRSSKTSISMQIHRLAKIGVIEFLVEKDTRFLEGLRTDFLHKPEKRRIIVGRLKELKEDKARLDDREIEELARELSRETGIPVENIKQHIDTLAVSKFEYGELTEGEAVSVRAEKTSLRGDMREVLTTLKDRERKVLDLRFGLNDDRLRTLEEIGLEFGVRGERIRQIEEKALRKLRHPSRSKIIKDYWGGIPDLPISFPPEQPEHLPFSDEHWSRAKQEKSIEEYMCSIGELDIPEEDKKRLVSCGIRQIGDFFSAPAEEIREAWGEDFKRLQNILRKVSQRINIIRISGHHKQLLIRHIAEAVIYKNKEEAFKDLTELEERALKINFAGYSDSAVDSVVESAMHKIFAKAYKEFKREFLGK